MYTVIPTEQFEKDVKYYIKKKGFTNIGADIKAITDELEKGNLIGTEIPGLRIRQMGILSKSDQQIQIPRQGSPTGIALFIMQFGMMRKCIYLRFIIKRTITGYRQIRRL